MAKWLKLEKTGNSNTRRGYRESVLAGFEEARISIKGSGGSCVVDVGSRLLLAL